MLDSDETTPFLDICEKRTKEAEPTIMCGKVEGERVEARGRKKAKG